MCLRITRGCKDGDCDEIPCGRPIRLNGSFCDRHENRENTQPPNAAFFLKENEGQNMFNEQVSFFANVNTIYNTLKENFDLEASEIRTKITKVETHINELELKNQNIINQLKSKKESLTNLSDAKRKTINNEIKELEAMNIELIAQIGDITRNTLEPLKIRASDCDKNSKEIYILAMRNYQELEREQDPVSVHVNNPEDLMD